jgi:K(+)-stimulated pyrophosphate-energized sodium pump
MRATQSGRAPTGFETYGVTGVALITFILLAVPDPKVQVQLLVWIFVMRIMMLVSSALSYFANAAIAKSRYAGAGEMNFEAPLTDARLANFDRFDRADLHRVVSHGADACR